MRALTWIVTGLLAGWVARRMMRSRSYGVAGDLILGLLGGLLGGWVMHQLGVTPSGRALPQALVALIGAMLFLGSARLVTRFSVRTRRLLDDTHIPAPTPDLETLVKRLGGAERSLLTRLLRGGTTARDPNVAFEEGLTVGQRLADRVATFGGSWTFIGLFMLFLIGWMIFNTEVRTPYDPYPFILLNLVLSLLAALQAPVIMMSQNRQAAKDRLEARLDYEVNLRAELEIQRVHAKIDDTRGGDIAELLALQRRQAELLGEIREGLRR
jgi:uncharacterized membrane protein/uncharacterized membrane protein YeaQ/YmgE (transglycosylase-associated protein family)